MAKGSRTTTAPPRSAGASGAAGGTPTGPPLLLLGLGYLSILVSLPLVFLDTIPPHVVGYVTGSLIPILVIGFVRRIDLQRRRNPYYVAKPIVRPALVTLAVLAVLAAGLHVWPIATELAS